MWEICTEKILYEDIEDLNDVKTFVLKGYRPNVPGHILGSYASLMKECWAQSPLHRPDFDTIVNNLRNMLNLNPLFLNNNSNDQKQNKTQSLNIPTIADSNSGGSGNKSKQQPQTKSSSFQKLFAFSGAGPVLSEVTGGHINVSPSLRNFKNKK